MKNQPYIPIPNGQVPILKNTKIQKKWILFIIFVFSMVSLVLYIRAYYSETRRLVHSYSFPIISPSKPRCTLPNYDIWKNDMSAFIHPEYNPHPECNRTLKRFAEVENGYWRTVGNDSNVHCRAKCADTDGNYTDEETQVNCEAMTMECDVNGTKTTILRTQIIPKNPSPPGSHLDDSKPNVFVILLDSLGYGDAKRSFNKTIPYMVKNFEAVEFPFINKVGENSRPNAVAIWFGKQLSDVDNTLFGGKLWKTDLTNDDYCKEYLDDYSHLYKDFRKKGYKTMNGEDWGINVLEYPDCKGWKNHPYDHGTHKFLYRLRNVKEECREPFRGVVEYMEQFMNAYPDDPKFSWIWLTDVAHDHESSFYRVDGYFEEFMKRNREMIDKSIFILMGDHGQRIAYPGMLETKTAHLEISNPYFSISIPKKYRKSGILEKMRENAKNLQSHFDTRATLLDIVRYQPSTNFTSTDLLNIPDEKGHSYFRSQPDFDRNCGSLPIPPEFCICQSGSVPVKDDGLVRLLGSKVTDRVNEIVREKNFQENCIKMELKNITLLEKHDRVGEIDAYVMHVKMDKPSGATYRALIQHELESDEFKIENIIRTNSYGSSANCISDQIVRPFCFCKSDPVPPTPGFL